MKKSAARKSSGRALSYSDPTSTFLKSPLTAASTPAASDSSAPAGDAGNADKTEDRLVLHKAGTTLIPCLGIATGPQSVTRDKGSCTLGVAKGSEKDSPHLCTLLQASMDVSAQTMKDIAEKLVELKQDNKLYAKVPIVKGGLQLLYARRSQCSSRRCAPCRPRSKPTSPLCRPRSNRGRLPSVFFSFLGASNCCWVIVLDDLS